MHLSARHRTVRTRQRRGYSLVELMITVTMLGIIGTIVANLLMGQQRFFQRTNEQMGIRRELRTSLSILPTELRGIASTGGDLIAFSSTDVTFHSTLGVSLVCAKGSTTSIDIPPLGTSRTITSSWYSMPAVGDTVFAMRSDSSGTKGDFWSAHRIVSISSSSLYCPVSPFIDAVMDLGKLRYRLGVSPALDDSVVVSSPLRFARSAKYSLTQQASGNYYLTRTEYLNGAWGTGVPVSGPYKAPVGPNGGLSLAFYDSTGTVVASVANAAKVARMDVTLRAQGLNSSGLYGTTSTTVIDSLAMRVALRNRR